MAPYVTCGCGTASCPFVTVRHALEACVRDAAHAASLSTWAKEQFSCSFCSRDGGCQEVASCATSGRGAQITGLAQLAPRVFAAPYLNYGTQLCGRTAPRRQEDGGCRSILAKQLRKLLALIQDALACDPHAQPLAPPRLLKFYEAGGDVRALCELASDDVQAAAVVAAQGAARSAAQGKAARPAARSAARSAATGAANGAANGAAKKLAISPQQASDTQGSSKTRPRTKGRGRETRRPAVSLRSRLPRRLQCRPEPAG